MQSNQESSVGRRVRAGDIRLFSRKGRRVKEVKRSWLVSMLLVCVLGVSTGVVTSTFLLGRVEVLGISMEPTYYQGDCLWIDKVSMPIAGDIVVVRLGQTYIIKRVIAVAGDTIQIKDGIVFLDGNAISEPYVGEVWSFAGCAEDPLLLKDGEFFVMGDNREHSGDSRMFGPVQAVQIEGRLLFNSWW